MVVVALEPVVTQLDGLDRVHIDEATNVFENQLLHVLVGAKLIVSHHDVGLDV